MARLDLCRFRASLVGYVSGSLAIGTITVCYLLAKLIPQEIPPIANCTHEVQPLKGAQGGPGAPLLPFISDLGMLPPEKYVFRVGLVLVPAVFVMQACIVYRVYSSKICLVLGIISAICLSVVAVVSEIENYDVHCAFAFGFFILIDVYMVLISWWSFHDEDVPPVRRMVKPLCAITAVVAILCLLTVAINQGVTDSNRLLLALCEWIATGAISIFQVALGTDVSNVELRVSMTDIAEPREKKQD